MNFSHQIRNSSILGLFSFSGAANFIEILIQSQFIFVVYVLVQPRRVQHKLSLRLICSFWRGRHIFPFTDIRQGKFSKIGHT